MYKKTDKININIAAAHSAPGTAATAVYRSGERFFVFSVICSLRSTGLVAVAASEWVLFLETHTRGNTHPPAQVGKWGIPHRVPGLVRERTHARARVFTDADFCFVFSFVFL